jgi:hypothetical protein
VVESCAINPLMPLMLDASVELGNVELSVSAPLPPYHAGRTPSELPKPNMVAGLPGGYEPIVLPLLGANHGAALEFTPSFDVRLLPKICDIVRWLPLLSSGVAVHFTT